MINLSYSDLKKLKTLRYILLVIAALFFIAFLKIYFTSSTINKSIYLTRQQKLQKLEEINFKQNYYLRYLDSPYYIFFLKHETKILDENEKIIQFIFEEPQYTPDINWNRERFSSPSQSWIIFWKEIWQQNTRP